jgi:NADPH:quinone reductase-like Zn-dependent oxidoreductase
MSFTGKKIVCKKLSSDFRDATEIISTTLDNVPSGHVILKSKYLGINASDINYTSGRYLPGVKLPFDCGFECVGTVVAANGTKYLKEGNHVFLSRASLFFCTL